jgi:phosphoglycolate phosphatase
MLTVPAALPDLIIFDWDDTLVDSYAAIHAAINAARAAFGLPTWTLLETRENCRIALKEIFPQWFGAEWEKAQDIFYTTFAEHHIAMLNPKAGALELLQVLAVRKIPLAVNSNKKNEYLREEIDHLHWGEFFSAVVGAGDAVKGKPAPDGVIAIRNICRIGAEKDVWFVGDNSVDSETARAGGALPIIIDQNYQILHGEVVFGSLAALLQYIVSIE